MVSATENQSSYKMIFAVASLDMVDCYLKMGMSQIYEVFKRV
jgi:hypothetical protein